MAKIAFLGLGQMGTAVSHLRAPGLGKSDDERRSPRAIAGNAPRHRWHRRQCWRFRICKLQIPSGGGVDAGAAAPAPGAHLREAGQFRAGSVLSRARAYQALNALPVPHTAPAAFIAHLAVDADGYALSIKDSADPCGFAYFSDQSGVIYAGEYIR